MTGPAPELDVEGRRGVDRRRDVELLFDDMRERLEALDPFVRAQLPDRTIVARCEPLGLAYRSQLRRGSLGSIERCSTDERADVVLELDPDDVERLLAGTLDVRAAWRDGRLRVRAAPLDLLRLRALR